METLLTTTAKLLEKISNVQNVAVSKSTQSKDASREDLLIAWASSYAGHFAVKTVSTKITAIKREQEKQGLVWQGREQLPVSSFCGKRPPVTISILCDLNRGLSRSLGLDLLPPTWNIQKFNPLHHATFSHIAESTAQNGACSLHLPWSKTQKAQGDDVWIPRQEALLDPIYAIHKHFIWNKLDINYPIATYRDSHDNIITLTRSTFIQQVNRILRATNKGYPHITGHCFHIGGTTFYLVSGVPPDMVKKFGHWCSQAFLEYWCCLDYLGAMHIEMLPTNLQPQPLWMRSLPKA
ncbi:hypothetical protein L208DRAFT_1399715 [Tricholoma matsutake]|nr:hypothetical protein L208DRAFT_1399715 [Tricholoma matsutake 945]